MLESRSYWQRHLKQSKKLKAKNMKLSNQIHNKFDWDMREMARHRDNFKFVNFVRKVTTKLEQ